MKQGQVPKEASTCGSCYKNLLVEGEVTNTYHFQAYASDFKKEQGEALVREASPLIIGLLCKECAGKHTIKELIDLAIQQQIPGTGTKH